MRRLLAAAGTALAGMAGAAFLAPQALPLAPANAAAFAPADAGLQLEAARTAALQESPESQAVAAAFALRSLDAMPYNQPALALSNTYGRTQDRLRGINLSAALGWRDLLANARLVERALAENAPQIAAQRVDAVGRVHGGERAANMADLVMTMEGGASAMAERAGNRASALWWITYLRLPASSPDAEAGRLAFARALDADNGPWRRDIVTALTGSLQGDAARGTAHDLWRDTLAEPGRFGIVLYDEDLQGLASPSPAIGGEWRVNRNAPFALESLETQILFSRTGQGQAVLLGQAFPAATGSYRLTVEGESDDSSANWTIQCASFGQVFETDAATGSWAVELPSDCTWATLQLSADAEGDAGKTIRLRRVTLEPAT